MYFVKYNTLKRRFFLKNNVSLINILIVILFLIIGNQSFSQTNAEEEKIDINRLQGKDYPTLEKAFWQLQSQKNLESAKEYASAYLHKAKSEKDIEEIANAYYMLIYSSHWDVSKVYVDSIIAVTKDNINYNQPAKAYILKANDYGANGQYKEAFIALDKAYFCAKTSGNIEQLYGIKYFITRLKTDVGDYQSNLSTLKDIISYHKEKGNTRQYIITSWAYANNFNLLKEPDSALVINKEIIPLSLKTRDSVIYNKLLLSTAISYYEKENFKPSLDSILKLRELNKKKDFGSSINVLMNLYQGKIYLKQHEDELAIKNFKKVDSISTIKNYFHSLIRENYTLMYNYYKEKKDIKNQLKYINKLLVTDSILDSDYAYLAKNINSKYTTPNLVLEKQNIIKSLKKTGNTRKIVISVLGLICVLLVIALFRNNRKKKYYKKFSKELGVRKKGNNHTINNETTKKILTSLANLEHSKAFLNKDFSLPVLAKLLNTNTSYLSRIINDHKNQTFKQYLIDLRINELIKNLDENPVMRKYSIEALADSIGYKNPSSFTRIFKNYTGVSPSEYLKKNYSE